MQLFSLLVIFQVKHFICDFPLQGKYMLGKFKSGNEWIVPLTAHCAVHMIATFLIVFQFGLRLAFLCSALDLSVHFVVDRIKASPNMLGRFKPDNKFFWWSLGFDQMAHHLTHYFIIYIAVCH